MTITIEREKAGAGVPLTIDKDLITLSLDGEKIEFASGGDVTIYTNENKGVLTKHVAAPAAGTQDHQIIAAKDGKSVSVNGVKVELTGKGFVVSTYGRAFVKPAVAEKTGPAVGDRADDGWIYAGVSPETHKPMFVQPEDAGVMRWRKGKRLAKALLKKGKAEARLPSDKELFMMFNKRAAIRGFDEAGVSSKSGLYWSSVRENAHDFKFGNVCYGNPFKKNSVRLVRS